MKELKNTAMTDASQQKQQLEEKQQNNLTSGELKGDERSEITVINRMIEKTPFAMLWLKEKGFTYGIAEHRLGKWYETEKEMMNDLNKTDWDLIAKVIVIMIGKEMERRELENLINN